MFFGGYVVTENEYRSSNKVTNDKLFINKIVFWLKDLNRIWISTLVTFFLRNICY